MTLGITQPRGAGVVEVEGLRDHRAAFRDRHQAGWLLAHLLAPYRSDALSIFAVPAGGVCVAAPIAQQLGLPLDLLVVDQPGPSSSSSSQDVFGAGGLAGQRPASNARLVRGPGVAASFDDDGPRKRLTLRLDTVAQPALDGAIALLVDHGLASGATMSAAVGLARRAGASQVWVAVPTGPDRALRELLDDADRVFCPNVRSSRRFVVADAYERFCEVDEAHVMGHLRELENMVVRN